MATKDIPTNDLDFKSGKVWNDSYTHTGGALAYTIYNPNPYAVDVLITIKAGSGVIEYSDRQVSGGYKKYYHGAQGNKVSVFLGNYAGDRVLILSAAGGLGSQEFFSAERSWRGNTKGWSSWSGIAHARQVAQSGDVLSCVRTLGAKKTLEINYADGGGAHKGSHSVSVIY